MASFVASADVRQEKKARRRNAQQEKIAEREHQDSVISNCTVISFH